MSNYQELLAQQAALAKQAAELEKQLQEARRVERAGVIAQIKNLLTQHGLTVEDLGLKGGVVAKKSSAAGRSVEPKYRNKDTGETWSGRGLKPKWVNAALAQGKSLDDLKI